MHRPSSPNNQDAISKVVSRHAAVRMQQRAIPVRAVDAALTYGRQIQAKGVTFCVIGRKEVKRYAALGVDLSEIEGLQVLVGSDGASFSSLYGFIVPPGGCEISLVSISCIPRGEFLEDTGYIKPCYVTPDATSNNGVEGLPYSFTGPWYQYDTTWWFSLTIYYVVSSSSISMPQGVTNGPEGIIIIDSAQQVVTEHDYYGATDWGYRGTIYIQAGNVTIRRHGNI